MTTYIPDHYLAPTADAATKILGLIAKNLDADQLARPHKLGALKDLVCREIEKHQGSLGDDERGQWRNAVTGATHRLKDGTGCLEYHPPSMKGGHGTYMFKSVSGPLNAVTLEDQPVEAKNVAARVYGWCLPHYQRDDVFPVKVGRTERDPLERAQDSLTNLPEDPKVVMDIPCSTLSEAEKTEMIFHHVLRMRGRSVRGRGEVGHEWFMTNSRELREIAAFVFGEHLEAAFAD